ncbi:MAG: RIP metalloprotease RseP, partial [Bdellovibrio sp.]
PLLKPNPNLLSTDSHIGDIPGLSLISRSALVGIRNPSKASSWGLKTGDRIKKVQNTEVSFFRELENLFVQLQGSEVRIEIERATEKENPEKLEIRALIPKISTLSQLGIESSELFLYQVITGSPAERGGLKAGDRILKAGQMEPKFWEDILNAVKSFSGEGSMAFLVERGGEQKSISLTPALTKQMTAQGSEEKRFTVGIVPLIQLANPELIKVSSHGILDSVRRGWERTWDVCAMTVMGFLRLIQNKISPKNIGGVITIGQAASETFKIGLNQFLQMMAIISVNLFILNLLPIPVLDGGHLLFYTIEALRGAPLSMRKMEIAQQVGLVILMSLMVFALFNDFSRIFGFW